MAADCWMLTGTRGNGHTKQQNLFTVNKYMWTLRFDLLQSYFFSSYAMTCRIASSSHCLDTLWAIIWMDIFNLTWKGGISTLQRRLLTFPHQVHKANFVNIMSIRNVETSQDCLPSKGLVANNMKTVRYTNESSNKLKCHLGKKTNAMRKGMQWISWGHSLAPT